MSEQDRTTLKSYFQAGDRPTEQQFIDLIDSMVNRDSDNIIGRIVGEVGAVSGLEGLTLPSVASGLFVELGGYHAIGDSGNGELFWDANEDKQNHNGITIFSPTWNNGTFGNAQDANWFTTDPTDTGDGVWKRAQLDVITAKQAGARGDYDIDSETGVDDTFAIQSALDNVPKVVFNDGSYLVSETLNVSDNTIIQGESKEGSVIYMPSTTSPNIIEVIGPGEGNWVNITAEVGRDDYIIPVNDTTPFSKDDVVQLDSSELLGYVDSSGTGSPRNITEYGRVKEVDATNNTITLYGPVYFRYLTTETIRVRRVDMFKNVSIKNIKLQKNIANSIAANDSGRGIVADYCQDLVIENVSVRETIYAGIQIQFCFNTRISGAVVKNVEAAEDTTLGTHYSISIGSLSTHVLIEDAYLEDSRHAVSIGGLECVRDVRITDSVLISTEDASGIPSPAAADNHFGSDVVYESCYILGGARVGPLKTSFVDCDIHNGNLEFCVGTRGQSVNNEFPREIHYKNCDLYFTGSTLSAPRGPVFTTVSDDADLFIEKMTDCNVWFLGSQPQNFDFGGSHVTLNDNNIRAQFEPTPPVPVEISGGAEFYQPVEFSRAVFIEANDNYIEGGIVHQNSAGILRHATMSDNTIYNSIVNGIRIHSDASNLQTVVKLDNNIVINSRDHGIELQGIKTGIVSNTIIEIDHPNEDTLLKRGVFINAACDVIKLLNNDITTEGPPYQTGANTNEDHLIGNDFKDLTGAYNQPAVVRGPSLYQRNNKGWPLSDVIYEDATYSAFRTYAENTILAGTTDNLAISTGTETDRYRISLKIHVLHETDESSGGSARALASSIFHVTALALDGTIEDAEAVKMSGIGDATQNADLTLGTPVIGADNFTINVPFNNGDGTNDMRVSATVETISWFGIIRSVEFVD